MIERWAERRQMIEGMRLVLVSWPKGKAPAGTKGNVGYYTETTRIQDFDGFCTND